ncbi:hypothetical protein, partial [[Clostridium] innocuum]|uniref:hypothetical protein n=1 Tax=Clostridium innocuum TaxID=1522 RepID=UPI0005D21E6C
LYSTSEKIDEQVSFQKPFYDKTGLGFNTLKENDESKEPDLKISESIDEKKSDEINKSEDTPKEEESPKQEESPKGMQREFKGRCFACNTIGHMKRDCTGKQFKPLNGYCYNCHGFGHRA